MLNHSSMAVVMQCAFKTRAQVKGWMEALTVQMVLVYRSFCLLYIYSTGQEHLMTCPYQQQQFLIFGLCVLYIPPFVNFANNSTSYLILILFCITKRQNKK